MKPISINTAQDIAFGVNEDGSDCADCLFYGYECGCQCSVGNVLKLLVDKGFLTIDESAEGGEE